MTWRGCKCIKYRTTNSSSRLWRYLQRTPLPPSTTYSRCWMTLPSPSGYSLSLPHSLYDVDLFNTSFLFFHLLLQAAHQEVVKMRVGCCAAFSFLPFFIYFFFIHVASGTEWPNQTRNEQRCGWTEDQTGHEAKSTSCLVHCFEDGLKLYPPHPLSGTWTAEEHEIFFFTVQVQARHAQSPSSLLSSRFKYLIFFVTTEYNNNCSPFQRVEEKKSGRGCGSSWYRCCCTLYHRLYA